MNLLSKFYNVILSILVIVALLLAGLWQYSKNENRDLRSTITQLKLDVAQTKTDKVTAVNKMKADYTKIISDARIAQAKSESILNGQINEIQSNYDRNLLLTDSLRKQVSNLNSKIANLSRPKLEAYATTGADNLVECTAATVELEDLARRYYSEREFYRTNWPESWPAIMSATDLETGASKDIGSSATVKGKLTDIEPVVP